MPRHIYSILGSYSNRKVKSFLSLKMLLLLLLLLPSLPSLWLMCVHMCVCVVAVAAVCCCVVLSLCNHKGGPTGTGTDRRHVQIPTYLFEAGHGQQAGGSTQEARAGKRQEQAVGRMPGQAGQPASTRFGEAQISFPLWRPHAATLERTQKKQTNQNMCIYIKKEKIKMKMKTKMRQKIYKLLLLLHFIPCSR